MNRMLRKCKRIRIVVCKSSTLTKTVVLSTVTLALAALLTLNIAIHAAENRTQKLAQQAAQLEQENSELEQDMNDLGSADSVKKIAGEELDLVDPDTVIIEPEE